MAGLYAHPDYYEIAFDFRDVAAEVDFFESCIDRFGNGLSNTNSVLEVACGPSPYLLELDTRGYDFTGLDNAGEMISHSIEKARDNDIEATFLRRDMADFYLLDRVDFAFCALGSLYLDSNDALRSHLDSVADALTPGSLYCIDGSIDFPGGTSSQHEWETTRGDTTVEFCIDQQPTNVAEQLVRQTITTTVTDGEETRRFREEYEIKTFAPQEFCMVVEESDFEHVGWFDSFDLSKPVSECEPGTLHRPMTILRKRD
ncbi:Methyltransferase domain-containing protein [Haladaptatus litoreus]|uniref:Methyltransferase domain-containing protein n=1 Tax=Haladaptatus litoreus TaxID=553468 RepID=A0A1N6XWM6_9EURY|nr:class I SAM-dependent methyltransferase [Haladaptatus litoreus]SIR06609.1 Methyltransferase domain-containing protein [Haladaptatus litoreus]